MQGKMGRGRDNSSFAHIPDYNAPLTIHQNFTLLGNRHPILHIQPFSQSSHLILRQLFLLVTPIHLHPKMLSAPTLGLPCPYLYTRP